MDIVKHLFKAMGITPFHHVRRQRGDGTLEPELAPAAPWSQTASLQNKASADLDSPPVPCEKTWCALLKRDYPFKPFDSLVGILLKQQFFGEVAIKSNFWALSLFILTD